MGERENQRRRRQRTSHVRNTIGEEVRRLRVDAGLSARIVAKAAGISAGHLSEIERGRVDASTAVLVAVADVLGADLSIRAFPNTGPRMHDRLQAPIIEELIRLTMDRWRPRVEVAVYRPARGAIDVVLVDQLCPRLVATEVHSQIGRLEQQTRWAQEKVASLPSSDLWRTFDIAPEVSSLLILRSTAETRILVDQFAATIATVYPARPADLYAALVGDAPWPGAGLLWARVEGSKVAILDSPPRGVRFGR